MRLLIVGNRLLGDSLDSFPAIFLLIRYFNYLKKSGFTAEDATLDLTLLTYRYSAGLYRDTSDHNLTGLTFKEIHLIDEKTDYLEKSSRRIGCKLPNRFNKWKQYFYLIKFTFQHRGEYDGVLLLPGGFGWGLFACILKVFTRYGILRSKLGRKKTSLRTALICVGHGNDWRAPLLSQAMPYYTTLPNYENFLNLTYALINELNYQQNYGTEEFVLTLPGSNLVIDGLQATLLDEIKNHILSTLPQTENNSILPKIKKAKPKWVVISPTASEIHKTWPGKYFYSLTKLIVERGYEVGWVGLEREREAINVIRANIGENLAGNFSLPELFNFIKSAHAFIGNDSGLAHAATMLGTNTAVIYGPGNPVLSRPFTSKGTKLFQVYEEHGIPPAARRQPRHRQALSMDKVSPEQVWKNIEKIF